METKNMLGLVSLLVVVLVSPATNAATDVDALSSCLQELKTNLEERVGNGIDVKLHKDSSTSAKKIGRRTVYHLDATNPKTGDIVAKVDCVVDANAKVIKMETLPMTAKDAVARSYQR